MLPPHPASQRAAASRPPYERVGPFWAGSVPLLPPQESNSSPIQLDIFTDLASEAVLHWGVCPPGACVAAWVGFSVGWALAFGAWLRSTGAAARNALAPNGGPARPSCAQAVKLVGTRRHDGLCWIHSSDAWPRLAWAGKRVQPSLQAQPATLTHTLPPPHARVCVCASLRRSAASRDWCMPEDAVLPEGSIVTHKAVDTPLHNCDSDECDVEISGAKVPLQRVTITLPPGAGFGC